MPLAPLRVAALVLAIGVAATASGCAATHPPAAQAESAGAGIADDFVRSRLVAADFVDVIAQLPALAPRATVLSTPTPDSRFGELLFGALQDAGYDMRIGAGAGAALDYTIGPVGDASGPDGAGTWTFLVSAGPVKLKRDYAVDAAGIRPVSTMMVHGADASAVVIDHARFERAAPTAPELPARSSAALATGTASALRAAPRPAPVAPAVPVVPAVPAVPVGPVAAPLAPATPRTAPAAVVARAVPVTPPRADRRPTPQANMYETRRSAFAPILAGYEILDRRVMVFGNDSLVMGADNKRLARALAERFDADTDVISLIGCSHGATALADGNRTLALGRAARVKEELVIAGVAADLVLDEGCWAGRHFDKMPARGVVVAHRRRAG